MSAFIAAVLAFPTVVFTVCVAFFVLYAVAALAGVVDTDWDVEVFDAGIPVVLYGGIASIFAWLASYIGDRFLPDTLLLDSGIGLGAGLLGLGLSALAVRPLRGVFETAPARHRNELVGKVCTIRSLRVDEAAGTAEVGDYIAEVRCFRKNELTLGSNAIVYDYDADTGVYHVGPIDPEVLGIRS
jgi:hypothetical protein